MEMTDRSLVVENDNMLCYVMLFAHTNIEYLLTIRQSFDTDTCTLHYTILVHVSQSQIEPDSINLYTS
jgi:hypothetical protein